MYEHSSILGKGISLLLLLLRRCDSRLISLKINVHIDVSLQLLETLRERDLGWEV